MIRLSAVHYSYPHTGTPAIQDVSLSIRKGECVMITGPSGAGKTTLCLAAAGILTHEYGGKKGGTITLAGRDILTYGGLSDIASTIGIVFDDPEAQLIFTTVEEEILSALERQDLSPEEIEDRLGIIMEMTRLTPLKDRAPHTLSGGQKQRLILAVTLAMETDVLILDEPTSELDEHGTQGILGILRDLKTRGKTIIIVEHKFSKFREIIDTLVIMQEGKIRASGAPGTLVTEPEIRSILMPDFTGIRERVPRRSNEPGTKGRIQARGLSHTYHGDIHAIREIDVSIDPGEFVAIVGENGSGKTTLIKHFNGLLRPTAGSIEINGSRTERATITELARDVGMVFQNPDHMFFADTVWEEVAFGVGNIGLPDMDTKIGHALTRVRLHHARDLYPRWLSRGERQRLAIACVLAMEPSIIVLDEPTTGLDGNEAREVMEVLKELQYVGHTIIIVTHSREIANDCADRVITMEQGRIISDVSATGGTHD